MVSVLYYGVASSNKEPMIHSYVSCWNVIDFAEKEEESGKENSSRV